jgi:hypothetical protein
VTSPDQGLSSKRGKSLGTRLKNILVHHQWQQKKPVRAGGFLKNFTESYLVGALKKYAQTCSIVVWYNIFNAITLFINIAKAQVQYELVFSKWPTIVKILCGFLTRSPRNSDVLKIHVA